MTETIITLVLVLVALGQLIAIRKGKIVAIAYYLCVAPLGYFQVWYFGSWDPTRICGLLLIFSRLVTYSGVPAASRFFQHRLSLIFCYGILITLIGMAFWPTDAMAGRSPIYGPLRGFAQILNWMIIFGVAWQINLTLLEPDALDRISRYVLIGAFFLCGYAIYQSVAYELELPATGIRRPMEQITATTTGEQYAAYFVANELIYRPGSLVGEPKGLGSACVIWLAFLFSTYFRNGLNLAVLSLGIILLWVLWISASTSSWIGTVISTSLAFWLLVRRAKTISMAFILPILMFGTILGYGLFSSGTDLGTRLHQIVNIRLVERLSDPLGDLAEKVAFEVLDENRLIILSGTGLGGISFYIAQKLGRGINLILFPNNGLLGLLCNVGVLGLALLIFALWKGFIPMFKKGAPKKSSITAFIGLSALAQCLIFPQIWLFSIAIGFLIAAETTTNSRKEGLGISKKRRFSLPRLFR